MEPKFFLIALIGTILLHYWISFIESRKKRYPKKVVIDGNIKSDDGVKNTVHMVIDMRDEIVEVIDNE